MVNVEVLWRQIRNGLVDVIFSYFFCSLFEVPSSGFESPPTAALPFSPSATFFASVSSPSPNELSAVAAGRGTLASLTDPSDLELLERVVISILGLCGHLILTFGFHEPLVSSKICSFMLAIVKFLEYIKNQMLVYNRNVLPLAFEPYLISKTERER